MCIAQYQGDGKHIFLFILSLLHLTEEILNWYSYHEGQYGNT